MHSVCRSVDYGGLIYSFPPCFSTLTSSRPYVGGERASRPTDRSTSGKNRTRGQGREERGKKVSNSGGSVGPPASQFSFLFRSFSTQETLRRIFRCRPGGQQIGLTLWGEEEKVGASQKEFYPRRVIRLISSLSSEILVGTEEVFCQHLRSFCAGTKKTVFLSPFPPPPVLILPWP